MASAVTRTARTTAASETAAERQKRALELRKRGLTFDAIATQLGYSDRSAARHAIRAAIAEITREPAEEVKKLELERLDALYVSAMAIVDAAPVIPDDEDADPDEAYDAAMKTRLDAIRTALKVSERRSKLEGLDAPVKVQEVAPETMSDAELLEAIDKERAAVAARLEAKKGE